jgi:uncharacterized protein YjiS (DUF1127 family)
MAANEAVAVRYAASEWLRNRVTAFLDAFKRARIARETRRELYALSDHILRDIGLRRDQIALVGRKDGPRI